MSGYVLTAARAEAHARGTQNSAMHKRWRGEIITPALITYCQAWLRVRFGIETTLLIERGDDGRNRVDLCMTENGSIHQAEMRTLNALRKRDPKAPMERVLLLFERIA